MKRLRYIVRTYPEMSRLPPRPFALPGVFFSCRQAAIFVARSRSGARSALPLID